MPQDTKTEDFLALARERFDLCSEAEHDVRELALDDLTFRKGQGSQWPDKIRAQRDRLGKPCLELNVLPARERQILNNLRQNRPQCHVNPVDDKADIDTAEVLEGLLRHIWYDSNADAAIDTAAAAMVRGGFAYARLVTEREDKANPFNENLVIKIKRVRNAFNVYLDPNYQEADSSDAKFGFVFSWLSKDEYDEQFKGKKIKPYGATEEADEYESELCSLNDWAGIGDRAAGWIDKANNVRIAEYYYTTSEKKTWCLYSDGTSAVKDEKRKLKPGIKVVKEREAETPCVKWAKINGIEVLDETDWPGQFVPLIPFLGDELDVDGKRILEGLVRHTKDAVRMNNYLASGLVQSVAISQTAPWLAPAGSIEKYRDIWKDPDGNVKVLVYDPVNIGGALARPPERIVSEPPIQALAEARSLFAEELKSITGIEDAQLGRRSNEQSGRAIDARKQQGELSNFHYADNCSRAIGYLGRQIIDIAPKVYDTARVMRIIGEDGTQETVQINGHLLPPDKQQGLENLYDITVGRYDVTVSSGPSYQTKRQEQADFMVDMAKAYPNLMASSADLVFKTQDVAGAKELAERQRKFISLTIPGLIEDDEQEPIPPQAQQQIAQKTQEAQAMHAYAQQVEQERDELKKEKEGNIVDNQAKLQMKQMDMQMKEKELALEYKKLEVQLAMPEITTKAQEPLMRQKIEGDLASKLQIQDHAQGHEFGLKAVDGQQQQEMSSQDHAETMEQGEQGHQQALEQGDAQAANQAALGSQTHEQTLEQQAQAAKLAPKPAPKKK